MEFRWLNPGGPGIAQEQANAMSGYRPAQVAPQQPYVGRTPVQYANPGQGANYQFDSTQIDQYNEMQDLRAEYDRNSARIAEIEGMLKRMSAGNADSMDRQLAISRARAGDLTGAYNHLARIDNRKLMSDKSGSTDKQKVKDVVVSLEDAYIMRNAEDDATKKAGWDNKIARLSKEYRDLTGKEYQYLGANPDNKVYGLGDAAGDKAAVMSKLTTFKGARKDGRLTTEQISELYSDVARMPNGPEKNELMGKIYEASRDNAEKADANAETFRVKVNNARKKLMEGWEGQKIKKDIGKIPGKSVERTIDGIKFTITYTGINPNNGKKVYEVSRNGKVLTTREED